MRITRNRKLATLAAAGLAAAAVLATGGYAMAASTAPPVCVTHGTGTTAAGNHMLWNWDHKACPAGTYGITLPAGPKGVTGATGPAGPAGAPGPSTAGSAGLDVIEVTQGPSDTGPTTAVCPATHPHVLGGGGAAVGSKPNWIGMAVSKPVITGTATTPNAWQVEGVPDGAESFTAYAMCAR